MVYKALTNGFGGNLNSAADGFGRGADTVIVLDNSSFGWENAIKTYEGNDYIDASALSATGLHCVIPGAGDDYYIGNANMDSVRDGQGNDVYYLGDGLDIFYDGAGNDFVDGGSGGNYLYFNVISGDGQTGDVVNFQGVTFDMANSGPQDLGVFGIDTILNFLDVVGSMGSDHFYGDSGENIFWTYSGNDVVYGRGGNDTLYSYGGNDILIGGSGADTINLDEDGYEHYRWGQTYEHFRSIARYTAVSDSLATRTGRDHIYWFDSGNQPTSDKIDLSRLDSNHFKAGNQAFSFDASSSRFASSNGEVRLQEVYTATSKYTIVHIDTDSDVADEMQIIVHDVVGMTKADFIL
jgi:Ca2+-binding RTX toxin-like protein